MALDFFDEKVNEQVNEESGMEAKESVLVVRETDRTLSCRDESYLCLLCIRDSTERIANLYFSYIQLRHTLSAQVPPLLLAMMMLLQEKRNGLEDKLREHYPDYMAAGKWHDRDEQSRSLACLSEDSREDLQKICVTEMRMLLLVSEMMGR